MNNPIYNMGGEVGGDPVVDQLAILLLVALVVIFIVGYCWWSRRLSSRGDRPPKP